MTQKELDNIRLVVEDRLHNWIKTSKSRRHVITIPSLAKQLDLPTKQVQTYFDKVCPLGFYGWLAKVRAKAAQEVISQHCDWDDIKVAQYVGLDTSHELEVVFKCTNGMTPSRWRDSVYQYDGKMPPHIQRVVDSIAPKLTEWEKNKGYCSLNVSVKDLSKQLDIPNHELELYISVIHPKGFDKHIDQLRISESKKIMTQNPSLSTSDVAKMVGYSGLFTFSQAFYRLLKILPSEWKQSRGLESNLQQNEFFPFDNEPIIEWIEKKGYCKPRLTIKDVAKQVGFTESSLSKYIRRSENLSFTEWISKLRYEEANRIFLKKPWLSYAQIAEQIGYSRRMSFARWYKLQTELNLEKQNE